jgi:hypothetical protein
MELFEFQLGIQILAYREKKKVKIMIDHGCFYRNWDAMRENTKWIV